MSLQIKSPIHGVITALATPFFDQKVDYDSLEKLIRYQLEKKVNALVVNGTTAESPTLTEKEVEEIFIFTKKIVGEKIPLILGTGSNSTQHTIEQTKKAEQLGADAALVVVPYYNKPPQRGLCLHFKKVADETNIPIVMYNVPGRTITTMGLETTMELAGYKNIIAIKEASGDLKFDQDLFLKVPKSFVKLSGDDPTFVDFMKLGGNGIISVMSNAIPKECHEIYMNCKNTKYTVADEMMTIFKNLIQLMYIEANPIPIKWILFKMGLFRSPEARLPLVALDEKYYGAIEQEMKKVGLIK